MAAIYITDSSNPTGAYYELPTDPGSELTIGSDAGCSISLAAAEGLAACHCRISCMEEGYAISDAGSGSGTYADDRQIESEYMAPGIHYRAGSVSMVYVDEIPTAEVEAPAAEAAEESASPRAVPSAARKVVRRKAAPRRTGLTPEELKAAAEKYKRANNARTANLIYVILVLIAAFYAGLALYSWMDTGNPLPIFLR